MTLIVGSFVDASNKMPFMTNFSASSGRTPRRHALSDRTLHQSLRYPSVPSITRCAAPWRSAVNRIVSQSTAAIRRSRGRSSGTPPNVSSEYCPATWAVHVVGLRRPSRRDCSPYVRFEEVLRSVLKGLRSFCCVLPHVPCIRGRYNLVCSAHLSIAALSRRVLYVIYSCCA